MVLLRNLHRISSRKKYRNLSKCFFFNVIYCIYNENPYCEFLYRNPYKNWPRFSCRNPLCILHRDLTYRLWKVEIPNGIWNKIGTQCGLLRKFPHWVNSFVKSTKTYFCYLCNKILLLSYQQILFISTKCFVRATNLIFVAYLFFSVHVGYCVISYN